MLIGKRNHQIHGANAESPYEELERVMVPSYSSDRESVTSTHIRNDDRCGSLHRTDIARSDRFFGITVALVKVLCLLFSPNALGVPW